MSNSNPSIPRREFLRQSALAGGSALVLGAAASSTRVSAADHESNRSVPPAARTLNVAGFQMLASHDLEQNERSIRAAVDRAAAAKVDFLLTPEGSASGYYNGFDRAAVAKMVERLV